MIILEDKKLLTTLEEIKAISDPYRMQIITTLKKLKRPATVKEIADKMGETPAKVYYHVKKLEKVYVLHIVKTEEINGIIAKYYDFTAKSFSIKHNNTDPDIDKLFLNEFQRAISNIYDQSKKIVLEQLENYAAKENFINNKNGNSEDDIKEIALTEVYLTEEDVRELSTYISHFIEKHKTEDDQREGLTKYHMFTVFFPIEFDE